MGLQSQANSQTQMTLINVQQTPIFREDQKTPIYASQMLGNMGLTYTQQKIQSPISSKTQAVLTPTISSRTNTYADTTNYSFAPVKINATGISEFTTPDQIEQAQLKLQRAEQLKKIGGYAAIGSFASSVYDAQQSIKQAKQYTKDVRATIGQYETQKKLIDANIAKQEEMMTETYTENMAQADVMYAGRNVDISSEALTGVKQKAGIDLSEDITDIRERGELNKSALDLDYAMNVKKAAQEEKYASQQAFSQITGAAFNTALTLALL